MSAFEKTIVALCTASMIVLASLAVYEKHAGIGRVVVVECSCNHDPKPQPKPGIGAEQ